MSNYRFEMTPAEFDSYIIRAKLEEQERIIKVLENHKLLPTYSKAASEFLEESWNNIKERLTKEIKDV